MRVRDVTFHSPSFQAFCAFSSFRPSTAQRSISSRWVSRTGPPCSRSPSSCPLPRASCACHARVLLPLSPALGGGGLHAAAGQPAWPARGGSKAQLCASLGPGSARCVPEVRALDRATAGGRPLRSRAPLPHLLAWRPRQLCSSDGAPRGAGAVFAPPGGHLTWELPALHRLAGGGHQDPSEPDIRRRVVTLLVRSTVILASHGAVARAGWGMQCSGDHRKAGDTCGSPPDRRLLVTCLRGVCH